MPRRIAHVSDLHFGAEDPRLAEPLIASLVATRPDLVVVSGDLTQRATRRQFEAVRSLIARLPAPAFVVPGNHDIPLWNVALRFGAPRRRWREHVRLPWSPSWHDDEVAVASLVTPRPWRAKEGAVTRRQLEELRAALAQAPAGARRVVVTHHPLAPVPTPGDAFPLALGAHSARHALRDMGVVLVLSGHLHVSGLAEVAEAERRGLLFVQCPSTLSHRLRGESNGYVVIDLDGDGIRSRLHSFDVAAGAFVPSPEPPRG